VKFARMLQPSTPEAGCPGLMAAGCSSFARRAPYRRGWPRPLKLSRRSHCHQDPGKLHVVLDDKEGCQSPSRRRSASIVLDCGRWTTSSTGGGATWRKPAAGFSPRLFALAKLLRLGASPRAGRVFLWLGLRSDAGIGQVQDEGAALSGSLFTLDLAAEQAGDLARDGKTQSGARRTCGWLVPSACWNASKMIFCLLRGCRCPCRSPRTEDGPRPVQDVGLEVAAIGTASISSGRCHAP